MVLTSQADRAGLLLIVRPDPPSSLLGILQQPQHRTPTADTGTSENDKQHFSLSRRS